VLYAKHLGDQTIRGKSDAEEDQSTGNEYDGSRRRGGRIENLGYHVSISKNPMLTKSPSGIEFNLVVQASLYGAARAEPSPFSPLQG
jgi:hypothetical protein